VEITAKSKGSADDQPTMRGKKTASQSKAKNTLISQKQIAKVHLNNILFL